MIYKKIYAIVKKIPPGRVLTYKSIAQKLKIKDIRIIGYALNRNPDKNNIPCHRVVKSDGSLATGYAFGGLKKQLALLRKEKVVFLKSLNVDLKKALWR